VSDTIVVKEKQDAATLRWLQMAAATEKSRGGFERPILSGMKVDNGRAVAVDGFRMHVASTPELLEDFEGEIVRINEGKGIAKGANRVYSAEVVEGNYPDWKQIVSGDETPQSVIAFNSKYLREALGMPQDTDWQFKDNIVTLRIYKSTAPVTVTSKGGNYQAVVMPIHLEDKKAREQAEAADSQFKELRELAPTILRVLDDDYYTDAQKLEKVRELAQAV